MLQRVLDFAAVALAAEQAGGAQAALDMSVGYLNTRVQFGQLIGAFQALKHMAADVLIEVESAKSAAYYALNAAAEDSDGTARRRLPGPGVLQRGLRDRGAPEHPVPRRDGLYLGSARRTCTSSAPDRRRSSSATPARTAKPSPSASASSAVFTGLSSALKELTADADLRTRQAGGRAEE